jgi:hypothetical protein
MGVDDALMKDDSCKSLGHDPFQKLGSATTTPLISVLLLLLLHSLGLQINQRLQGE